jgi:hypothetical protein
MLNAGGNHDRAHKKSKHHHESHHHHHHDEEKSKKKKVRWRFFSCGNVVFLSPEIFLPYCSQDHKHHKHHHHHHHHKHSSSSDEHKKSPHSPKHHHHEKPSHEKHDKSKEETWSEISSPASAPITPRARPPKDLGLANDIEHAPNTPPSHPMKKVYSVCLPPGGIDNIKAHDTEHTPNSPPNQPTKKVYSVCLPPGIDNIKNLSPGSGTHKFAAL